MVRWPQGAGIVRVMTAVPFVGTARSGRRRQGSPDGSEPNRFEPPHRS
ncbi:hypothetical protein [Azospirillum doebereinerae]